MGDFVLGVGNILLKDEGIGCHVVQALEKIPLPDVKVVDGGTCPDVVQFLDDADKLIVVDAAKGGGIPGQVYRFHLDDIFLGEKPFLSLHDMGLADNLMLTKLVHNVGETVIIGIEPKEIDWGLELSPELQERIPQIIELILAELNNTANPKKERRNADFRAKTA
jgi:hydrogenase maturation protease